MRKRKKRKFRIQNTKFKVQKFCGVQVNGIRFDVYARIFTI